MPADPDAGEELARKLADYRQRAVTRVKLGLTDLDGVIRGKYLSLEKFESVLAKGGGFCDCVLGWDVNDQLYDRGTFTGWHTGFPDVAYRVLVGTERWLAEESCPYFIAELVGSDDRLHPLCPRNRLAEVLRRLQSAGLTLLSGFEYEFFVFAESPHGVRDKGYRNLRPLTPGNFGYSVLRASAQAELFNGLMAYCESLDCPLEGLHCETGPGVWEAALHPRPGLEAADQAALFKTFSKVFFQRRDCMATFMAKWSMDYPGQSGHYHFSLLDASLGEAIARTQFASDRESGGRNRFHDPSARHGMSDEQRWAVSGLVRYLPELLALVAPTINSYTRLVPGAWAPTASTWGIENRTAAVRVIPGGAARQHIECRVPGADSNPYLVAAAVGAAALAGIEERLEPPEPVTGNAYALQDGVPDALRFPRTLEAAAAALERSDLARRMLGDVFVDHFVMTRRFECAEYGRHLNDWQLGRYFEII